VKFRVDRNELTDAVAWTARTLPSRPTVPVLAGLLLDADAEGGLRLSGFDFEVSSRASLQVDVRDPGQVLVSGRLLAEITRALPAAPVDVASDGNRVVVTCGNSRFTLPTLPVEDYPELPSMPTATGQLAGASFATAVAQVAVAAGRDDALPVLTGVRVEIERDRLTLAATDRYRLAVRTLRWRPADSDASAVALVPARTLHEAARSLAGTAAEVTIAIGAGSAGESLAGFESGGRVTTTRLLDGEFPRYRSLLPTTSEAVAQIDTTALIDAVKRVSLVAARTAPVRLTFAPGEVVLEAGSGDEAQASERLDATFESAGFTIAFNPGYLLDGLQQIDSDVAQLSFTTPTKPAVLTGKRGDDGDGDGPSAHDECRYLLMPVRLAG
jgi:DNA polymerase-3 subunit beta